jgi:Holliday junction resolvase RusA-like endonuclease
MTKNKITLIIPGAPIAKKRPRFCRRGQHVMTYNAQETEEGKVMWHIKSQLGAMEPIMPGVPIALECRFEMPIPKSMPKRDRDALDIGFCGPAHVKKPDVDNLVKLLKDCCNGLVWHDDSQVVSMAASKVYAKDPRTVFTVRW